MLRLGMGETAWSVFVERSSSLWEVLMGGMEGMGEACTWWGMVVYLLCLLSDIKSISKQRKGLTGKGRICMGGEGKIS